MRIFSTDHNVVGLQYARTIRGFLPISEISRTFFFALWAPSLGMPSAANLLCIIGVRKISILSLEATVK